MADVSLGFLVPGMTELGNTESGISGLCPGSVHA